MKENEYSHKMFQVNGCHDKGSMRKIEVLFYIQWLSHNNISFENNKYLTATSHPETFLLILTHFKKCETKLLRM